LALLGIDIGTTHVKARAYDEGGRLLADARRPTPTKRLPDSGAEYAADALEGAAFGAAREVVERVGPPRAIGVASMAESGFLLGGDGRALAPAIAWFDGRTAPQADRWSRRMDARELFARTGLHVTPLFTACKLEWLRENSSHLFARAAGWLGMSEYLAFRMTGERATEPSLAGRTMLYGIRDGGWDEELCALAGIPPGLLPPVREAGAVLGGLTREGAGWLSTPAGTPVVLAGHDHICGAFGAGATAPGEIVDSMGTAEASLLTLTDPPLDEAGHDLGLPVGCHVLPEKYYVAATLPRSGGLVEQLKRLLEGDDDDLARWTREASGLSPGGGGVCLPPADEEPDADGLLVCTLADGRRPGHLLRAVLEGLTLKMNHDLKQAVAVSGTTPSRITLVGGGAQSGLWAQLKADASGLPVRVVSDPECVARGAALLAGVGTGVFSDTGAVPAPNYEEALKPCGDHAEYERLYAEVHEPLRSRLGQLKPAVLR
jgi:xylulokinase